jgi:hypothetical protein
MAMIYSEMGYDALFLGRIDNSEILYRSYSEDLEFIWRPFSKNHG